MATVNAEVMGNILRNTAGNRVKKKLINQQLQSEINRNIQNTALNTTKANQINLSGSQTGATTPVTSSSIGQKQYSTDINKSLGTTITNSARLISKGGAKTAEGITDSIIDKALLTVSRARDYFQDPVEKNRKIYDSLTYDEKIAIGKQNTTNETNEINKGLAMIGRIDLMSSTPEMTPEDQLNLASARIKIDKLTEDDKKWKDWEDAVRKNIDKDYTGRLINLAYSGTEDAKNLDENSYIKENSFAGGVLQGIGQQIWNIGTAIATSVLTGHGLNVADANPYTELVPIYLSSKGSALEEAYNKGSDLKTAQFYSVGAGLLESALEGLSGPIPGLGTESGLDYLVDAGIDKISNRIVRRLLKGVNSSVSEGMEEVLSDLITPYLQRATIDPNAKNATGEQIANSFFSAAIVAGIMNLPNTTINLRSDIQEEKIKNDIKSQLTVKNAAKIQKNLVTQGMDSHLAFELVNESLQEKTYLR